MRSHVNDSALTFVSRPMGQPVQSLAGIKQLERSFRRLRLLFSRCIYEVTGPRYALRCFVTHVEARSAPISKT